jgi:hypothetical protein
VGGTERGGGDGNRIPACQHATPLRCSPAGRRVCVRARPNLPAPLLQTLLCHVYLFSAADFAFLMVFTGSVRSANALFCGHVRLGNGIEGGRREPAFAFTIGAV